MNQKIRWTVLLVAIFSHCKQKLAGNDRRGAAL